MKISRSLETKIDSALKRAFETAEVDSILRVILTLRADLGPGGGELNPKRFKSRVEYRKAAASAQQRMLAEEIGPTLSVLEKMHLKPRGGRVSPVVVVEGPAQRVLESIGLDAVERANADQEIELIRPERGASV